jgi:hypothetical protein
MIGTSMATISTSAELCAKSCHGGGPDLSEQTRAHLAERRSASRSTASPNLLQSRRPAVHYQQGWRRLADSAVRNRQTPAKLCVIEYSSV